MKYNTESVDAIYVESGKYADLETAGPGAFSWLYAPPEDEPDNCKGWSSAACEMAEVERGPIIGMIHLLPGAGFGHVNIRPNYKGDGASWDWDGNIEKPTLTPSVHALPIEPYDDYPSRVGWHGFLRNGRWESC